jgi:TolB-like protein
MECLKKYMMLSMLCLFILIAGCRGGFPAFYVSEDVDLSFIKRVAVMPFDNLTNDKFAGEVVRHVVVSELLATGVVDVVVPGQGVDVFNKMGIKSVSSLNEQQIIEIGKSLKVQALILGTIEQYGETKTGSVAAPEVTVTLMMADTSSGTIVWSMTNTRGGAGFMARHFGARSETLSEVVLAVVRESVQTLFEY